MFIDDFYSRKTCLLTTFIQENPYTRRDVRICSIELILQYPPPSTFELLVNVILMPLVFRFS